MAADVGTYFADTITVTSSGSGQRAESRHTKGITYTITERVSVAAADDDGQTWTIGVIPSNAIVQRGKSNLSTTEITAGTDYDLGIHEIDDTATNWLGDAVDADVLMDGQTMAVASLALSPVSSVAAGDGGKPLWELLGESADTNKDYLVVLTANTVGSAAGSIYIELAYTV